MAFFSRKSKGPFIRVSEMTMHWDTEDPFIFVSHHEDDYPAGNRQMAPPLEEISGRIEEGMARIMAAITVRTLIPVSFFIVSTSV